MSLGFMLRKNDYVIIFDANDSPCCTSPGGLGPFSHPHREPKLSFT